MLTDDPGTPEIGHWEINTAFTTEHRAGETVSEVPLVDINFGLRERVQLKYEVPWLRLSDRTGRHEGLGNPLVGVKWRFYDAGEKAWQLSTFPQLEFNNPGSRSDERGMVGHGLSVILPFQAMKDFGVFSVNADVGYIGRSHGGDEWFGGFAIGREVTHGVALAAELHGNFDAHFRDAVLTTNFGARVDLSKRHTLLVSVGRELHQASGPHATLIAYLGLQTRL